MQTKKRKDDQSDKMLFTTSQAAEFCNVTRFTIRNWINCGKLKSKKTAGGHRRISKDELVRYVLKNNISKIKKTIEQPVIQKCWEFFKQCNSNQHDCANCLAFKAKADKCFLIIRELAAEKVQCKTDCRSCGYLKGCHPEDWNILNSAQKAFFGKEEAQQIKDYASEDANFIHRGLYTSGRCFASIKNVFVPKKWEGVFKFFDQVV